MKMRLSAEYAKQMRGQLHPDPQEKLFQVAKYTGLPINEIIDYSERNWDEDKFRFNDDKEVLEEIFVDFNADGSGFGRTTMALITYVNFSYLDLATAIELNKETDPSDIARRVWKYVQQRADPPLVVPLGEDGYLEAEQEYCDMKPDFSNPNSEGCAFTKDVIDKITEHLAELGYITFRSV